MSLSLKALALVLQASCLLAAAPKSGAEINWDKIQPRYPTQTPWDKVSEIPQDVLLDLINQQPQSGERYPGYKKGTLDLSGVCGISGAKDGKIVGGSESAPHKYPWMAALFVDDQWFCGGTLISDEWVLTAAHCADGASEMLVMLGAHNVREGAEEGRMELTTTDFFTHPDWSQMNIHNDLALIHLPQAINFTDKISPVCLPAYSEAEETFAHLTAWASGWGKPTDSASSISPVLREVDTETITNLLCKLEFLTVNRNIICISGKGGKSTCNGDSGGPLHLVDTSTGVYKQIGITSFGSSLGCEIGFHAAFTRTASYLEWIETNTNIEIQP